MSQYDRTILFTLVLMVAFSWTGHAIDDYATFLGGQERDAGYGLVLNPDDTVIIVGLTHSDDFPVTAGLVGETEVAGENDLFLVKLTPSLGTLLAATYIGGSDHEGLDFLYSDDQQLDNPGPDIALDSSGNILITGATLSADFPTTPGSFRTEHNGQHEDGFLLRISADMTILHQSTLFGGSHRDMGQALLVEPTGTIVVVGDTRSEDFPVTSTAFDLDHSGGLFDTFIMRFNKNLSSVVDCSYFGAEANDYARDVVIDDEGACYITGWTTSGLIPTTDEAFDPEFNDGARDCYVAKFSPDFRELTACTYLGGHDWGEPFHGGAHEGGCDEGNEMALDHDGNLVVVGTTHSADFPITDGVFDTSFNDGESQRYDGFVSVFTPDLSTLLHSTYMGGKHIEELFSVAVDATGCLVVAGVTQSADFPVTADAFDGEFGGLNEGFVSRISSDLSEIHYSSYIGGSSYDQAYRARLDSSGLVAVTIGFTRSGDLGLAGAGYDQSFNGDTDAFIFKTFLGGADLQTVECQLGCIPASAPLPFLAVLDWDTVNPTPWSRTYNGRVSYQLPSGVTIHNYRNWESVIEPGETHHFNWFHWFEARGHYLGITRFLPRVEDVTPAPLNQPPYPPSGDTAQNACPIEGLRP